MIDAGGGPPATSPPPTSCRHASPMVTSANEIAAANGLMPSPKRWTKASSSRSRMRSRISSPCRAMSATSSSSCLTRAPPPLRYRRDGRTSSGSDRRAAKSTRRGKNLLEPIQHVAPADDVPALLVREVREQVDIAPGARLATRHRAIDVELLDAQLPELALMLAKAPDHAGEASASRLRSRAHGDRDRPSPPACFGPAGAPADAAPRAPRLSCGTRSAYRPFSGPLRLLACSQS